jgi:hypothetical protein
VWEAEIGEAEPGRPQTARTSPGGAPSTKDSTVARFDMLDRVRVGLARWFREVVGAGICFGRSAGCAIGAGS